MSNCDKREKIRDLKVKNLCVQNLRGKNGDFDTLKSNDATIVNLTSTNLTSTNLNTTSLNVNGYAVGRGCVKTLVNNNLPIVKIDKTPSGDPVKPIDNRFDDEVWDKLWEVTLAQKEEYENRNQCGRLSIRNIQIKYGCTVCPPDGYENCFPENVEGTCTTCSYEDPDKKCPFYTSDIWGIQSLPPVSQYFCVEDPENPIYELLSSVSYNLDVINVTENLTTQMVSVLVQVAYLNENGEFVYEQIDLGTRQFGATIDTCYGEKYTGSVILSTQLMEKMAKLSNDSDNQNTSIVQMVIFKETGVEIDIQTRPPLSKNEHLNTFRQKSAQVTGDSTGPVDTQSYVASLNSINDTNPNTRIILKYESNSTEIPTELISGLIILQSVAASQNALYIELIDNETTVGIVNVNIPRNAGNFRILATISGNSNLVSVVTPNPDAGIPVTVAPSPAGINRWRLQAVNAPIVLGNLNSLIIKKEGKIITFKINDITLGTMELTSETVQMNGKKVSQQSAFNSLAKQFTCENYPVASTTWFIPTIDGKPLQSIPWETPANYCGKVCVNVDSQTGQKTVTYGGSEVNTCS
jgi:hypothetical protein